MLAKLSPRAACVVRRILHGEFPEEIGQELGLKAATVRSMYHRAVLRLGEIQPRRLGAKSERPLGGPRARRGTG
jgi:DNA-directed RNA polymerase specialized sigma24 family protein